MMDGDHDDCIMMVILVLILEISCKLYKFSFIISFKNMNKNNL